MPPFQCLRPWSRSPQIGDGKVLRGEHLRGLGFARQRRGRPDDPPGAGGNMAPRKGAGGSNGAALTNCRRRGPTPETRSHRSSPNVAAGLNPNRQTSGLNTASSHLTSAERSASSLGIGGGLSEQSVFCPWASSFRREGGKPWALGGSATPLPPGPLWERTTPSRLPGYPTQCT